MLQLLWTLCIFIVLTTVLGLLTCPLLSYFLKVYRVRALLMLVSSRVCLWNHTLLLLLWFSLLCLLLLLRHLWFTFVSSGMSERRLGVIILESLVSPTYLRYLLLRSIIMLIKNHGFVSLLYRLSQCFRTIMMCFEIGELAH